MSEHENPEMVDVAGLQKSLDDLLKAADATTVIKGNGGVNIAHSGRFDERGHGGGGLETSTGGIDDLMIGKMIEAGVPFETVDQFVGWMKGKASHEEPDGDEGDDEGDDDEKEVTVNFGKKKGYRKSMDYFREDPSLADAFDVSTALESFVERNADLHDGLAKSIRQYQGRQEQVNGALAKAMHSIGTAIAQQNEVVAELGRRLGIVERTPAGIAKGATTGPRAQALQKGMPNEVGAEDLRLSKSQFCSTLTYMNLEKGIRHVAGQPTGTLATLIEAGAPVTPEVHAEVLGFLRTNPNEADKARNYA